MPTPEAAQDHYRTMQALQVVAVMAGRRAWNRIDPQSLSESWLRALGVALPAITATQTRAAFEGSAYSAMTLAQQGQYVAPAGFVAADAFAGFASDGRALSTLLYQPITAVKARIAQGMAVNLALNVGLALLDRMMATQIADVGRQAAGADIVARTGVGYVRMLNPPSCRDCTILAGRWYRWNAGFLRHPFDDCVHVASRAGSLQAAVDEGLIQDPYEAFNNLSKAEQDDTFGTAQAEAIRDGADISQVVNARRGMTANGNFTTEGTTGRGNASRGLAPRQRRMTPELIYQQAKSREEALDLLKTHGYILPGGQVPTGALRGQREGFGQLGAGGARTGAVRDIEEARRTGIRDPRNRNTMTAAERRLYDAQRNYETALSGRSPYTSPGFGNTPDPYGLRLNSVGASFRPVTQAELARAEKEYRRMLATGGQKFIT